eukprot:2895496-Rhodomonas_salina.1
MWYNKYQDWYSGQCISVSEYQGRPDIVAFLLDWYSGQTYFGKRVPGYCCEYVSSLHTFWVPEYVVSGLLSVSRAYENKYPGTRLLLQAISQALGCLSTLYPGTLDKSRYPGTGQ